MTLVARPLTRLLVMGLLFSFSSALNATEAPAPEPSTTVAHPPLPATNPNQPAAPQAGVCGASDASYETEAGSFAGGESLVKLLGDKAGMLKEFVSLSASCKKSNFAAQQVCLEACSPQLKAGVSAANTATNLISLMAGSMNKACGGFGDALKGLQGGFTGYSTVCAGAKGVCTQDCGKAVSLLDRIKKEIGTHCPPDKKEEEACKGILKDLDLFAKREGNAQDVKSVSGKLTMCEKDFGQKVGEAALNMAALVGSIMMAQKQCDQSASASSKPDGPLDCNKAANKEKMECICKENPRYPGCDNGLAGPGGTPGSGFGGAGSPPAAPPVAGGGGVAAPPAAPPVVGGGGVAAPPAAPPVVGGGGVAAPPAAAAPVASSEAAAASAASKTDLYESDSGASGASWSAVPLAKGQTLENQAKVNFEGVRRGPAGSAVVSEVSSSSGRSNWEKVKVRYIENKPSLLNE